MKRLVLCLILLITLLAAGCGAPPTPRTPPGPEQTPEDVLHVNYIDMGQGDATLIELPNGQTMLIDAGESEYGDTVVNYIKESGYAVRTLTLSRLPKPANKSALILELKSLPRSWTAKGWTRPNPSLGSLCGLAYAQGGERRTRNLLDLGEFRFKGVFSAHGNHHSH
jgi:hypothetical protein